MVCTLNGCGRRRTTLFRHFVVCFILVLLALFSLDIRPEFPTHQRGQPAAAAPVSRLDAAYGKLPLGFEANLGQTDRAVKFLSRGRGYALFLTGDEAVLTLERARQKAKGKGQKAKVRAGVAPTLRSANSQVAQHPLFGAAVLPDSLSLSMPKGKPGERRASPWLTSSSRPANSGESLAVLRLRLVGANAGAAVAGAEELPGKANYFLGNDPKRWRTNVPTYAQVKYQGVYPGIDLVYYGSQGGQLEYDFVVAPGADPTAIRFTLSGGVEGGSRQLAVGSKQSPMGSRQSAKSSRQSAIRSRQWAVGSGTQTPAPRQSKIQNLKSKIDPSGDLVVETANGDIRFHKPIVYQTPSAANRQSSIDNRKFLEGRYVLTASNQIRFALGAYDHTKPLVIDPVLSYSTYLGGSGGDFGTSIAVDSSGNAYVTGYTDSTNFPTANPIQATCINCANQYDAFVTMLNASGSALVYSTYLGGSGNDQGTGIAVDSFGNAYVTGQTSSTDFPTVNPLQTTNQASSGGSNAFVAMLNNAGSALVYSTYLGGSNNDGGQRIAVDSSGNAYVTGFTYSTNFPTVNPLQAANNALSGNPNAFVAKLIAGGSALAYSTYLGGSNYDVGIGIAVDSSGNAYVTGRATSTDFPTANPLQATNHGIVNAFVAKLNAPGSALVYSTYLGGSAQDIGSGITVDSSGNAYVTGWTGSTNFPTANPLQATLGGPQNAFLAKLNAAGSALVYSTYLGGNNYDAALGIAVDSSGNAYVTGQTNSTNFPTAFPLQASLNGQQNAFVAELNAGGSALVYSSYLGGSGTDYGTGIAIDFSGNPYVTGYTNSTNFPTLNPLQATNQGSNDAFVAKLMLGVTLSTNTLAFESELLNATAPTQSATLTNDGGTSLNITSIVASGDFALITTGTSCPYGGGSIAYQSTCTIDVSFTPTATGNRTGTVTITDTAASSPQTVSLSGTGLLATPPTISPFMSLEFPLTPIGTTSTLPVTVTNTASVALGITGVSIGPTSIFTETNNCLPSLAPGGSCTINVSFSPALPANQIETGQLNITDYAVPSTQMLIVQGHGSFRAPDLSSTSLSFGSQLVGTTSAAQPVTVTNNNAAVMFVFPTISTGWTQTNNCPSPVAAESTCTINVSFAPTANGAQTGTLNILGSDQFGDQDPVLVSLNGTGLGVSAGLSPSSLTFSSQQVGTTSAPQTVTLQNSGNQPLSITSMAVIGANSADFAQTNTCGGSVIAGASCTINVTFAPTAAGTRSAAVSIVDNAANSPQAISLTGTATAPTASLSASSLTFPGQFVGTTGLPQNITLTNNGDAPLTITSVQASAQFGVTNGCTSTLASGVNCTLSVFFDPSSAGSQTGTLTLTDNALGSPQTVALSGAGMDFALSGTTTSDTVAAGQTATYALSVAPEGGLNQTVSLTCSGAPSLATCTVPSSVTLNGTTSTPVTVSVSTTAGTMAPPWGKVGTRHGGPLQGLGRMLWPYGLLMLASLAALAGARKRRAACLLAFSLAVIMLWSACGGGRTVVATPGTPTGTYALSVTATVTSTAASTRLTHTINLTLNVN